MLKLGERFGSKLAALRESIAMRDLPTFPAVVIPTLDEGQLVGEVLEWLATRGAVPRAQVEPLQRAFFLERT